MVHVLSCVFRDARLVRIKPRNLVTIGVTRVTYFVLGVVRVCSFTMPDGGYASEKLKTRIVREDHEKQECVESGD